MHVLVCVSVCVYMCVILKHNGAQQPLRTLMRGRALDKKPCMTTSVVFVCLHMLLHSSTRVHIHTHTVHRSERATFSHTQQASSYCIMLRIWKGF